MRAALTDVAEGLSAMTFEDVNTASGALLAGWLGAGCSQLRLILAAHAAGPAMAAAASPNRRLIHELAIRAAWVSESGPEALQIVERIATRVSKDKVAAAV